jgi:type III restriction enzyme
LTQLQLKQFSEEEMREILFKHVVKRDGETEDDIHHKTVLDSMNTVDYHSVIGYFTQIIMRELRLVGGYDILYAKVKEFIKSHLFDQEVNLEDMNVLRNLSELEATKTIIETFKKKINELTVLDKGEAEIKDRIKISKCRPFIVRDQAYLIPKKSVFNKIIGDSGFELEFANFLENCEDITSYIKNYFAVHFKIDYKNAEGDISNYYPDFIVKKNPTEIFIIETKGLEDLDVPEKMHRLKQWVEDINKVQNDVTFDFIFVDEDGFKQYKPQNFGQLIDSFRKYKDDQ